MSEFKTIETQEELNSIIKSRLERERESVRREYDEKYSDYEDLKSQLSIAKNDKTSLETQIQELNDKVSSFDTLSARNKQLETDSLKVKVALSKGIPYEMAMRLNGDTEEDITKDAETMAQFIANGNPMPRRSTEEQQKEVGDEAYRNLIKGLKGE